MVRFLLVSDEREPCPYLPGERSRLPLRLPLAPISGGKFDRLLDAGERRAGPFMYRADCGSCSACESLRVPTARFVPSRSQRKVLRRNEGEVELELGMPQVSDRHLELYNRHKIERGLGGDPIDRESYAMQFVESCVDTREVRYFVGGKLVAVSLLDVGATAASSVYHYFDPDESRRSLGVYSVLREIELCREVGIDWYYLGFYVAACASLRYKADYYPHQRRIGGRWLEFTGAGLPGLATEERETGGSR